MTVVACADVQYMLNLMIDKKANERISCLRIKLNLLSSMKES